MNNWGKIKEIMNLNDGIITTKEITKAGIHRQVLYNAVKKDLLVRVSVGVYVSPNSMDDEYFSLQNRCPKGIFSLLSSLHLYGLTDVIPERISMTFPQGYNYMHLRKEGVECHVSNLDKYPLGIDEIESKCGRKIRCYNKERTLCEILNPKYQMDIRVIADAFKAYSKSSDKNLNELIKFAKVFRVEERVRYYMEVLL